MAGTSAHTALGSGLATLGARLRILPEWEKPEVLCPVPLHSPQVAFLSA